MLQFILSMFIQAAGAPVPAAGLLESKWISLTDGWEEDRWDENLFRPSGAVTIHYRRAVNDRWNVIAREFAAAAEFGKLPAFPETVAVPTVSVPLPGGTGQFHFSVDYKW